MFEPLNPLARGLSQIILSIQSAKKIEFKTEFVCDAPFQPERTPLRKVPLQGDLGVQTRVFFFKQKFILT